MNYEIHPEYTEKEMLFMEKEMLGIYISGHPLEKNKISNRTADNYKFIVIKLLKK